MADKWERSLDIYRSKDANLWLCSWSGEKRPFEDIGLTSVLGAKEFNIKVPFDSDDVIYGVDLKYPKQADGSRIYPTASSVPTEDMLMGYEGFNNLYQGFDPKVNDETKDVGLLVLQYEPDSLVGILKKMDIHPYMTPVPVRDLIRENELMKHR